MVRARSSPSPSSRTSRTTSNASPQPLDEGLLVLFDGHALFHRAFHAIKTPLSVSQTGEQTGAVYGFTASVLKTLGQLRPAHAAVAFDRGAATVRHKAFEAYKAQRPSLPDGMRDQFGRVRQVVETLGLPIFEMDDYEADDILGFLARKATERGVQTVIVTGDTDTMQLVSPTVRVLYQRGLQAEVMYDVDAVRERYGLEPAQIADLKALRGDPSDNIPGVAGIGEKTATALLQKFGSVEKVYEDLELVSPEKVREQLRAGAEAARQGKELTTIVTDLPLDVDVTALRWAERFDRSRVVGLFRELEFNSLIGRLPNVGPSATPASEGNGAAGTDGGVQVRQVDGASYMTVTGAEGVGQVLAELEAAPAIAVVTPPTSASMMDALPAGIALAWGPGKAAYVPLADQGLDGTLSNAGREMLARLKPVLERADKTYAMHISREALSPLGNAGVQVRGTVWDTSVAAHLLGRPSTVLSVLALHEFGVEMPTLAQVLGTGRKAVPFAALPPEQATTYACGCADHVLQMREKYEPQLAQQGTLDLFLDLEMALAPVLTRMERHGIKVDIGLLGEMSRVMRAQMAEMEAEIYSRVHEHGGPSSFNINSPKQLGEVLFEKLNLPHGRRTQTGYSTDASVLEMLRGIDPSGVVALILEYRELSKLASTYLDALPGLVNERTGRIHTSFNQTGSATGRISSSEPNLQNIPIRTETGRRIRRAFVAPEGAWLVGADYSQIELRVLAHLSDDPVLQEAFRQGEDIHAATASLVLNIPRDKVTSDHRRIAKAVNFGIVYGMSGFGLATRLEMERKDADQFINNYFARYPKVKEYIDSTIAHARREGYVRTLLGRRRYLPDIHAGNPNVRAAAERMAINMPVQGTAADVIKLAMVQVQERLDDLRMGTKMLLQIHDELLFEAPDAEREKLGAIVREVMPNVLPQLSVPLVVEVKTGRSWGEME
jgi:DNA polymerase-1